MTREARKKEIEKAMDLIGIFALDLRIKNQEDREIFKEIQIEKIKKFRKAEDQVLKDAGISF
jgi:hypothetical protein